MGNNFIFDVRAYARYWLCPDWVYGQQWTHGQLVDMDSEGYEPLQINRLPPMKK